MFRNQGKRVPKKYIIYPDNELVKAWEILMTG